MLPQTMYLITLSHEKYSERVTYFQPPACHETLGFNTQYITTTYHMICKLISIPSKLYSKFIFFNLFTEMFPLISVQCFYRGVKYFLKELEFNFSSKDGNYLDKKHNMWCKLSILLIIRVENNSFSALVHKLPPSLLWKQLWQVWMIQKLEAGSWRMKNVWTLTNLTRIDMLLFI